MNDRCYVAFSSSLGGPLSRLFGKLIRWFTSSDVNHAFLLFWSEDFATWMTLGANAGGLEPLTLDAFRATRRIRYIFEPVGWDLRAAMIKHAGDLGKAYNVAGLVGEAWVETQQKITGRYGVNFLDDHKEVFCSEWVAEVCATGLGDQHLIWDLHLDADQVDPGTLKTACLARPRLFRPCSPI